MTSLPYRLRPVTDADRSFVIDCWRRSWHKAYPNNLVTDEQWAASTVPHIMRHLRVAESVVACAPDDQSQILGWCVYGCGVLYYVYTRQAFRRFGLALALVGLPFAAMHGASRAGLAEKPLECACWTQGAAWIGRRRALLYNPCLMEGVTR